MTGNKLSFVNLMSHLKVSILAILLSTHKVIVTMETQFPELQQYCPFELFNATCPVNTTIIMQEAYYGRKNKGRCGNQYVGCSRDVIGHLERTCSGRRSCEFQVPDSTLQVLQPCAKSFTNYLEASYYCLSVEQGNLTHCSGPIPVNAHNPGYLASEVTSSTGKGSENCPWLLVTRPGQRLNITLYDFNYSSDTSNEIYRDRSECQMYAEIEEIHPSRRVVVCQSERREQVMYLSKTNTVKVIMKSAVPKKTPYFLLHYQPFGCVTPQAPVNGWMIRVGNHLDSGCNATGEVWRMRCQSNHWHLTEGTPNLNCSAAKDSGSDDLWHILSEDWSSPFGILVVSALGVALGLVIGVSLLFLVLLLIKKRKSSCLSTHSDYTATEHDSEDTTGYILHAKADADGNVTDHLELVNLQEHAAYGAMWRSRPPSYSANHPSATVTTNEPHMPRHSCIATSVQSPPLPNPTRMNVVTANSETPQVTPKSPAPDITVCTTSVTDKKKTPVQSTVLPVSCPLSGICNNDKEAEPLRAHSTFRPAPTNHSNSHPVPQPTARVQTESLLRGGVRVADCRRVEPHVYESPKLMKRNQSVGTLSAHAQGNL